MFKMIIHIPTIEDDTIVNVGAIVGAIDGVTK